MKNRQQSLKPNRINQLMQFAALLQSGFEYISSFFNTRYSMHLLPNGHWVSTSMGVSVEEIVCTYDAGKHTIVSPLVATTLRWPWLSVLVDDTDISDFFDGLRISEGLTVSDSSVLMLYAHQKKVLYPRVQVMLRDGSLLYVEIC